MLHLVRMMIMHKTLTQKQIEAIQISEKQAEFLQSLVRLCDVKSILEIGTLHGFSTSKFAEALVYNKGEIVSIEKSDENFSKTQENLAKYDNVKLLIGDALEILPTLKQKFDMIFIDANKSKYVSYLQHSIKLLNEKGLIVADNTLFRGYVYKESFPKRYKKIVEELQAFHKFIFQLKNFEHITFEVEDGMTILKKKS